MLMTIHFIYCRLFFKRILLTVIRGKSFSRQQNRAKVWVITEINTQYSPNTGFVFVQIPPQDTRTNIVFLTSIFF